MYSASFTNFWYHIRLDYTGLLIQAWSTTLQYWVKIFRNFHARASKCWKWNWKRRSLGGGDMLLAGEFSVTCNTVVKALSFSSVSTLDSVPLVAYEWHILKESIGLFQYTWRHYLVIQKPEKLCKIDRWLSSNDDQDNFWVASENFNCVKHYAFLWLAKIQ